MTTDQQRAMVRREVERRLSEPNAAETLTALVWEWRRAALDATARLIQAPLVGTQEDGTP